MRSLSGRNIYSDGVASELGYVPVQGLGGAAAVTLTIQDADITTKASAPTLSLGVIALTVNKGTVVTKSGSPTLAIGVIALTVNKGTVATKSASPTLTYNAPGGAVTLVVQDADVSVLASGVILIEHTLPGVVDRPGVDTGRSRLGRRHKPYEWRRIEELEEVLAMREARTHHEAEVEQARAMDMQRRENLDLARRQADVNRRRAALEPTVSEPQRDTGRLFRELAVRREVAARMQKQNEEIERRRKLVNRVKMARVRSHRGQKKS